MGPGRTEKGFPPATPTEVDANAGAPRTSVHVEDLRISALTELRAPTPEDHTTVAAKARGEGAANREHDKTAARPSPSLVDLPTGTLVGEWEIDRKIGEGGMGAVYSATHPILGKRAAIKVIGDELSRDTNAIARFRREAKAVAQLASPHIVDVFGFGELADGRAYFVMEYLTGESLRERLVRGRVPLDEALDLLDQTIRGLEAAHDAGIVHRDLKPENIFIDRARGAAPVVKLLDFGIVKLPKHDEEVVKTQPGLVIGTPAYAAPEQIRAAGAVDHRADIYALGGVAYELILGRPPFTHGTIVELIAAHLECAPPQPRSLWPKIPASLDSLLLAMLAKDPAKRPTLGHIQDTIEKLRRSAFASSSSVGSLVAPAAAAGPPVVMVPLGRKPAAPAPAVQPERRRGRKTTAIVGVALAIALVVIIAIIALGGPGDGDGASPEIASPSAEPTRAPQPRPATPISKPEPMPAMRVVDAGVAPAIRRPPLVTVASPATLAPAAVQAAQSPPASLPADGELAITSKPPCDLSIDGKPTGRHTPLAALPLAAGTHRVTLVNRAYGIDETVVVDVVPGKQARISKDYSSLIHVDPNGTLDPFGNGNGRGHGP